METKNKIALITGASRGLGKNMALKIAEKGLDVIITYHSKKEEAQEVVAAIQKTGRKAAALQLNAGDVNSFSSFFTELARILQDTFGVNRFDYLVNNAGIGMNVPFKDTTEEQFDLLMNIQFKGVYFLTQKALGFLNDHGGVVNVSSGLARFSSPGYSAYASMKGAIETLTRYQAKELGARGIRVNAVAPGAIATDFAGGVIRDNAQYNANVKAVTALGRVGEPDDIGGVVAFLCTEDARWVTAQRIEASGGMNL
ncbi:SDR family oxidoreductase [Chitinophaga filiformis]|uniref:SDR family NAD(P)-dependent oxidoreductase n=1 Tax=Chitinophaga filiformis TaxID=104663 RepID=UPI001F359A55|nr:SDR family oxidoreductase [Chitinophaga filiformis]MCF6402854.1 SDR family oxidoreductase [Chitinophaga filiformis]MCF6403228.1 SDR family oxidoreductase [Chitinophaga filiformis]